MNTTCEALRDDLLAYRDHELPAARRFVVRWHLTHCAACREELAIMEQITTDLLATESAPALDAGLRIRCTVLHRHRRKQLDQQLVHLAERRVHDRVGREAVRE